MFRQTTNSFIKRELHTADPRFKRLDRANSSQDLQPIIVQRNFPSINKGNSFDNSKENLYYESHLSKVRSACKLDETTIVSKYLNTIRKDYDQMSKVSRKELNSMQLKKREIDFIRQKNKVFAQKRELIQKIIDQKEKQAAEIKIFYENSKMEKNTLQHIINRMKKDQIFFKQYGRIKDQQLKRRIKQAKHADQVLIHQQQKVYKLIQALNECKNQYQLNRDLREKKYDDFTGKISDVKQRDRFIQQRKERTYQLQSIELNDTLDEKNIHMREIILAHKVADSLLECKVNNLIKQYAQIQGAFHLVKIKTCISEPQLLASKFFSYEQTAQTLLESINENQKRIIQLSNKKAALIESYRIVQNENLLINDGKDYCRDKDELLNEKKIAYIRETNENKLLFDNIVNWITKKYQILSMENPHPQLSSLAKLQELSKIVLAKAKQMQEYDLQYNKAQLNGFRMKKIVKQLSAEELSLRIRETQQMNQSNLIEEEFIKTTRQSIIKKGFSIKHLKRQSSKITK